MSLLRLLAALIASIAMSAFATPQPIDATDLWINPDESGWGVSVFHQGDTLFASLFVYGRTASRSGTRHRRSFRGRSRFPGRLPKPPGRFSAARSIRTP